MLCQVALTSDAVGAPTTREPGTIGPFEQSVIAREGSAGATAATAAAAAAMSNGDRATNGGGGSHMMHQPVLMVPPPTPARLYRSRETQQTIVEIKCAVCSHELLLPLPDVLDDAGVLIQCGKCQQAFLFQLVPSLSLVC